MTASAATSTPLEALAGFASLLREHGMGVGVWEQQGMVQAALALPDARPEAISAAWRAVACRSAQDWRRWPELFDRYWFPQRIKGTLRVSGQTRPSRHLRDLVQAMHESMDQAASSPARAPGAPLQQGMQAAAQTDANAVETPRSQGGASATDPLHDRSLSQWLPQDLTGLQRLAERIAAQLRRRLTRRWQAQASGRRLDLRRTLRDSVATGGLPVCPAWRQPRRVRPRLFILVDVSRSMETHAQLFLRIARAFVQAAQARVFVFHTRLAEITPLLQRDSGAVQEKVNAVTAGFGGGTRIATSLDDFVRVHARTQLQRGSQVWVLSDGFDADAPDGLAQSMARVRARGARVTWFHPTRGAPASEAMQNARALVERFIPLATVGDLVAAQHLLV
jgi:uncharacterized protein with von Willebrand factor type A (vWA) domain